MDYSDTSELTKKNEFNSSEVNKFTACMSVLNSLDGQGIDNAKEVLFDQPEMEYCRVSVFDYACLRALLH